MSMATRTDQIIEKAFLGGEFLTWLWFAAERSEGRFTLEGDPVDIHFEDLLVLESILADSQENTFKGGEPTRSEEARVGLRLGKKVSRAKMKVRRGEREFAFTIKASNLDLSSVKLPAVLSKAEEERFYERLYLLEELDKTVNGLFLGFLRRRLASGWEEELKSLRSWVARSEAEESETESAPPVEV
jgi:hypothetical protein